MKKIHDIKNQEVECRVAFQWTPFWSSQMSL